MEIPVTGSQGERMEETGKVMTVAFYNNWNLHNLEVRRNGWKLMEVSWNAGRKWK